MNRIKLFPLVVLCFLLPAGHLQAGPVTFTDASGKSITITAPPRRIVSLVPAITEILYAIGAGDQVLGHTWHNGFANEAPATKVVGGFFAPDPGRIEKIRPDLIILADLHKKVRRRFAGKVRMVELQSRSIAEVMGNIALLGRITGREEAAKNLVEQNRQALDLIHRKAAMIPAAQRQRVIRFMGAGPDKLMTPGDDSFQDDYIRAAGGIPPQLGKAGNVVGISKKEWQAFNPQVVYGCGDREKMVSALNQPGWRDVAAVKDQRIFSFPCDLTCRAGANMGAFVSWLSARVYNDEYSWPEKQIYKDGRVAGRPLAIGLDYIRQAQIVTSRIADFTNKTLVIEFKRPQAVLSTLEGTRQNIATVGNHYFPPPGWGLGHEQGLDALRRRTYAALGIDPESAAFLFTGADMDNLSMQLQQYLDMQVYALVTAGVKSNAVRMSKDNGGYYEPGTINILILTNMHLTPRAMSRSIISATEAKTAALEDLDIRSAYHPATMQATGTGTDNILVAQGTGPAIDNAGGHSKMGELIARAVYAGVKEAIAGQNEMVAGRTALRRLQERGISLWHVIPESNKFSLPKSDIIAAVEQVLLDPVYAGFMEAAFAVSDDYEAGLINDIEAQRLWCTQIAGSIAGKKNMVLPDLIIDNNIPLPIKMALNALVNGVSQKLAGQGTAPVAGEDME